MDFLKQVYKSQEVQIYRLGGAPQPKVRRYVISSPETRSVCNKPEIIGVEFKKRLSAGISKALRRMDGEYGYSRLSDKDVCVLHFLRGGLAFGLHDSLGAVYGFNRHMASFITSQRYKRGANWHIKFDQYRKLSLPEKDVNFFLADVVATGTTLENGLDILTRHCRKLGKNVKSFTLFTIGCGRAEEILEKYDKVFRKNFDYSGTWLFYIEGRFTMPPKDDGFMVSIPGTDLVRKPALLSPEFELSQYENPLHPIERCAVYDISSRVFEYRVYLEDVIDYWERVKKSGETVAEIYAERWPMKEYDNRRQLKKEKSREWKGVSTQFYGELFAAGEQLKRWLNANGSGRRLISERIKELKTLLFINGVRS
jgi:hypothetical protein